LEKSLTAALIASSASIEQCNLTGGRFKNEAISAFFIFKASSTFFPFKISVAYDEEAIADPHPKV